VSQLIFKTINSPNYATSDHWDTKQIKIIRYFISFLNSDLAKGGASAPLAPSLVVLLYSFSKDKDKWCVWRFITAKIL